MWVLRYVDLWTYRPEEMNFEPFCVFLLSPKATWKHVWVMRNPCRILYNVLANSDINCGCVTLWMTEQLKYVVNSIFERFQLWNWTTLDECNDCYFSHCLAFNWGMSTGYANNVERKYSLNVNKAFTEPSGGFMQWNSYSSLYKKQSQGNVRSYCSLSQSIMVCYSSGLKKTKK